MSENYRLLAGLIEAHPNREVIGRARLQKTVRLLQRAGLSTDYTFSIHFHGPYSEELRTDIATIAKIGLGVEETRGSEGKECFVIRVFPEARSSQIDPLRDTVQKLAATDLIVLELAATYDVFREMGSDHEEAARRLRMKKGAKCEEPRVEEAMSLLKKLGLPAPNGRAAKVKRAAAGV